MYSNVSLSFQILKELDGAGFSSFFRSFLGGSRTEAWIRWVSGRVVQLLVWTHNEHCSVDLSPKNTIEWLFDIVQKHFALIASYCQYCEKVREFKGSTIRGYVDAFRVLLKWFVLFRVPADMRFALAHTALIGPIEVLSLVNKAAGKRIVKDAKEKTIQELIFTGNWPVNGLVDLQNAVTGAAGLIHDLLAKAPLTIQDIDTNIYARILQVMTSSIWTFDVNARPKAVGKLRTDQFAELLTDNVAMGTEFKTRSTYGYQPIIARGLCLYVMSFYYDHIRPLVETEDSGDFFFLDGKSFISCLCCFCFLNCFLILQRTIISFCSERKAPGWGRPRQDLHGYFPDLAWYSRRYHSCAKGRGVHHISSSGHHTTIHLRDHS